MGGLFFVAPSAILSYDPSAVSRGLDFWWRAGWWPVIVLPLAWYVLVLWYSGYWEDPHTALHRRHRAGLVLATAGLLLLVGLVLFANPLPSLGPVPSPKLGASPNLATSPAIFGLPLLVVIYPAYLLVCVSLALDALLRPGPTGRLLGDLARRRARPWLASGSALLLVVSVLVAWAMVLVVRGLEANPTQALLADRAVTVWLGWFDLAIAGLIGLAALTLGQAMVAYEVFTGKSLPRRGLLRFWRNAVALSAGYGLVASWSLTLHLRPIYIVLLSTGLLSLFYALFAWRSYAERDRYMRQLRPFVTSQRLYDHLLEQAQAVAPNHAAANAAPADDTLSTHTPSTDLASTDQAPADPAPADSAATSLTFRALCGDVLDARLAYLAVLGPSAPLAGPPLVYAAPGETAARGPLAIDAIAARVEGSQATFIAVDPAEAGGAQWAVPLRSARRPEALGGLIGLLLLGEKSGGGLYTQEEIDIARAGAERLIDTLASAELARRLVVLQRQRLAESLVLDHLTRRVLHDDVLPQLHAAMLHLHALAGNGSAAPGAPAGEAVRLLSSAHAQLSQLLRDLPAAPEPEVARLGLIDALRRLAAGEFARVFDTITWQVDSRAEDKVQHLPPLAAEVLFYAAREAMRNAARHGRRDDMGAPLKLLITAAWQEIRDPAPASGSHGLSLTVEDNGIGLESAVIEPAAVQPADGPKAAKGDAPSAGPGSGQGLALHATLLAVVGGRLTVESDPGRYTRVLLFLPAEALEWAWQ